MRLRAERLPLRTRRQFVISRTAYTEHVNVVISLETDDGLVGYGEAAPNRFYEETADTAVAAATRLAGVLRDADEWGIEVLEARLAEEAPRDASVRAAVSAALHDILGKRLGAPVYRIFGLDPDRAPLSSFTIAIAPADELRQCVLDAAEYPLLKIKLGTDRDEQIVHTVREAAPGKRLFADANAAWSAERAVRMIELLAGLGVELVEQPLPRDDVEGHAWVRARAAIPIIADESCATAADIPGLAGAVDGINIKLAKCGSLREAMRMVHVARAHQLSVMAGCMIESSLGISAIAQIAPLLDYADLDGAALLADDPFTGVQMVAGELRFTDDPGLGSGPLARDGRPDHLERDVRRARAG
ncbi:dipeptide epimerase [soil metagenome]